jgi:phenylpropionate dioxygenase-like ring-hydroxylating dioxygenase large terminal subunit
VFNGAGQAFNPAGYAWDEATWNFTSILDAHTNQWRNVGVNLINGMPLGFRGSGASVLLPLKAGDPVARILNVGGTVGVTPGSYLATASSSITEIDTAKNDAMTARSTGSMNAPRWFPSAVVLPTGSVFTVNGSDVDMDWAPGMEKAVTMTELYDPARLFQEDVRMLEAQQRAIAANPGHEFYNLNIDAGSMWVRRILQRLIDAESGTHLSAVPGRVAG